MVTKIWSIEGRALKLDTREDIKPHLTDLISNEHVEEIILQGNTIGIGASEEFAEAIKKKEKIHTLHLGDIYTGRLIEEIPKSLTAILTSALDLSRLTSINLSDNAFGARTEAELVAFLSNHIPLQHLILNNNGLGPTCGAAIANALATLAGKKGAGDPKLETLVCGRNRLESGSMEAWAKAFAANSGVKTVRMVQNGIRQEGIDVLLRNGLSKCRQLQILDLQDNTFTIQGALALASVVENWEVIKELGIGDCLLSSRGGIVLAEALQKGKNKEMKVLRLQFNEIDIKGLKALKEAVKVLDKLDLLELNGNKFSEDDKVVEEIRDIFEERGNGELDSLSDMEDESDEEEDEDEEEKEERILKDADEEEGENVAQDKDEKVDELADTLGKASI